VLRSLNDPTHSVALSLACHAGTPAAAQTAVRELVSVLPPSLLAAEAVAALSMSADVPGACAQVLAAAHGKVVAVLVRLRSGGRHTEARVMALFDVES
jgi:hypothetical protein